VRISEAARLSVNSYQLGGRLVRGQRLVRAGLALVERVGARARGQRTSFQTEVKLSSLGRARPGARFEEPPQARLVKIAHGRLAGWLDPFGMLPSQVVVDLSLKLGHGVRRVTD